MEKVEPIKHHVLDNEEMNIHETDNKQNSLVASTSLESCIAEISSTFVSRDKILNVTP